MKLSKLFSFSSQKSTTHNRVVGIDIGSSSIKVVELEEREGILTLTTYGETQLGPYDLKEVGQSVALKADIERQALVDVLRESAVKADKAVLAMPLSTSFVTVMSLRSLPEEDLGPRIRVEARKYIPTQMSEITLDWAEIVRGEASEGDRDVLVAAIQNESLARFSALTDFVGFKKPPSEIECFSAIRALFASGEEQIAIIDIGAVSSKLYLARSGQLQRMHRVRAGGALATKRISEVLSISFAEAELKKRAADKTTSEYRDIERAHHTCFERALVEFRQVIDDYEKSLSIKIDQVTLSGGGALFPDLLKQVESALGKKIQLATPFSKVAYPAFMEDSMKEIGPEFAVALGAALRAFE